MPPPPPALSTHAASAALVVPFVTGALKVLDFVCLAMLGLAKALESVKAKLRN